MCLALSWALETPTQGRYCPRRSQSSVGDRWAKRHPGNKVRDAEREVWWAGSQYLPSTTVPALWRVPPLHRRCLRQPPRLPIFFARWQRAHPEVWANHDCPSLPSRHLSSSLCCRWERPHDSLANAMTGKSAGKLLERFFCFLIKERDAQGAFPCGSLSFPLVPGG